MLEPITLGPSGTGSDPFANLFTVLFAQRLCVLRHVGHPAIGVAMVIVGDLQSEGLVGTSQPRTSRDDRPDIELLERVLDGLRQL